MTTFGSRLKEIRKTLRFSQEELASQLNLTRSSISKCEKDKSFVSEETLKTLAVAFKVNLNYLIAGIGKPFYSANSERDEILNEVKKMFMERGL